MGFGLFIIIMSFVMLGIIGFPLGAMCLRGTVYFANRMVAGKSPVEDVLSDVAFADGPVVQTDNPYQSPVEGSIVIRHGGIPQPHFLLAYTISAIQFFTTGIAGVLIMVGLGGVLFGVMLQLPAGTSSLIAQIIWLGASLMVSAGVFSWMLPTTYKSGLLVAFLQMMIAVAVVGVAFGVLWVTSA